MKKNIIDLIESQQMNGKVIPNFGAGDTITVQVRVKEGNKERLQAFTGYVIAKKNRGINSSFTVRKTSHEEGIERVFPTYSPLIDSISVNSYGKVRRAKLYYLRKLKGKKVRIKKRV